MYQMCQIRLLNILPNKKKNVKKICQRFVKFCQSGEISPNMVPLIGGGLICHPCELRTNDEDKSWKMFRIFCRHPIFCLFVGPRDSIISKDTATKVAKTEEKLFFTNLHLFSNSTFAIYLYYHFISISLFYFSSYLCSISLPISLLFL